MCEVDATKTKARCAELPRKEAVDRFRKARRRWRRVEMSTEEIVAAVRDGRR